MDGAEACLWAIAAMLWCFNVWIICGAIVWTRDMWRSPRKEK